MPNMQSGIGAFIGLMSLSLVWVSRASNGAFPFTVGHPYSHFHMQFTILDLMEHAGHNAALFGGLFIIGTMFALASPIGGVFQGVGLIGIAFRIESLSFALGSYPDHYPTGFYVFLGPGYFLAIVSTFLVLTSVSVIRTANGGKPARTLSRFAALSPGSMSVFR
ncbi:MAG: hypothetical protein ABIE25_00995 [Thermoplasmatota archaeon]|nr:hypothetical protein [Candidatus Thermoplasmatota archaeon]MBU1914717.1 hypothetical protein [Candidatus Thermoplasmatota archaeon]